MRTLPIYEFFRFFAVIKSSQNLYTLRIHFYNFYSSEVFEFHLKNHFSQTVLRISAEIRIQAAVKNYGEIS